jgi:hypothetical protein
LHTRHASEGAVVYWQSLLDDPTRGRSPGLAQSTTNDRSASRSPDVDTLRGDLMRGEIGDTAVRSVGGDRVLGEEGQTAGFGDGPTEIWSRGTVS